MKRLKLHRPVIAVLSLVAVIVYLFVTAPPPLVEAASPGGGGGGGQHLPVRVLFDALATEQAAARFVFNSDIVTPGLKAGLRFSEGWKTEGVEAGPLPALLLREVSSRLQGYGTGVGLFLGSDFPISAVNRFSGVQTERFNLMKANGAPAHFLDAGTGMHTAMYIDPASAQGCVRCHNEHPESSKRDWLLNDPMGATTWLYRQDSVSAEEILAKLAVLRRSIRESYQAYLDRAARFTDPPVAIGDKWPRDGLFVPDADHFMAAIARRASENTLTVLLSAAGEPHAVSAR